MIWNRHSELEGKHAFLSPSNYHWTGYSEEKLITTFRNNQAKILGTKLHEFAHDAIVLKRLQYEDGTTLSMFVNDCIIEGLDSEVLLYFSDNAFGTADGISFENGLLRIYDLKTGKTPASMKQLEVYTGLFCLEYQVNPTEIDILLRIYQNNEIKELEPERSEIWDIIDRIIFFDSLLNQLRMEDSTHYVYSE